MNKVKEHAVLFEGLTEVCSSRGSIKGTGTEPAMWEAVWKNSKRTMWLKRTSLIRDKYEVTNEDITEKNALGAVSILGLF